MPFLTYQSIFFLLHVHSTAPAPTPAPSVSTPRQRRRRHSTQCRPTVWNAGGPHRQARGCGSFRTVAPCACRIARWPCPPWRWSRLHLLSSHSAASFAHPPPARPRAAARTREALVARRAPPPLRAESALVVGTPRRPAPRTRAAHLTASPHPSRSFAATCPAAAPKSLPSSHAESCEKLTLGNGRRVPYAR